jgi:hypothetical protein
VRAQQIFATLLPGVEFIEKVPDPEDIVWVSGEPQKQESTESEATDEAADDAVAE